MSRLCVIGNSHLVAVRDGFRQAGPLADSFLPSFFAAPGKLMGDLELFNGKLVPTSAKARETLERLSRVNEIDPCAFDAFLLVGLAVRFQEVARLYQTHRLATHAEADHHVISAAALEAAIAGQIEAGPAIKIVDLLRTTTTAPIFLIPEPLPGEIVIEKDDFWAGDHVAILRRIFLEQLQRAAKARDIELAIQGEETVTRGGLTKAAYLVGAVKLVNDKEHEQDQWRHMNAQYGAEILRVLLPRMVSTLAKVRPEGALTK